MGNCIFCKIVKKEIPAKIVAENDVFLVFRDINPQSPVHMLIIPKKHIASLNDISKEDEAIIGKIYTAIRDIARTEGVSDSGYRVVANSGKDAGQAVDHLHFHILGGRKFVWPPG